MTAGITPDIENENLVERVVRFRAESDSLADAASLSEWTDVNVNLSGGIGNDPLNQVDPFGLDANSYADCIERYRNPITEQLPIAIGESLTGGSAKNLRPYTGAVPPLLHGANAAANKLVGPTGRTGLGGVKSHPTSWQHKLGSKFGTWGSRLGKFLGRAAVVLTVAEGFWDLGLVAGCGIAEAIPE